MQAGKQARGPSDSTAIAAVLAFTFYHLQDFERCALHAVAVVVQLLLPLGRDKVAKPFSLAEVEQVVSHRAVRSRKEERRA